MKDLTQQSTQKINLVGKLLDATFNKGKLSDGRNYERVNLNLRVTQTYNNREETSDIPVSMFAAEYTNSGSLNPGWKSIQDLKEMKTVQNDGLANADTIRLSGVSLRENAFITKQLNRTKQYKHYYSHCGSKYYILLINRRLFDCLWFSGVVNLIII